MLIFMPLAQDTQIHLMLRVTCCSTPESCAHSDRLGNIGTELTSNRRLSLWCYVMLFADSSLKRHSSCIIIIFFSAFMQLCFHQLSRKRFFFFPFPLECLHFCNHSYKTTKECKSDNYRDPVSLKMSNAHAYSTFEPCTGHIHHSCLHDIEMKASFPDHSCRYKSVCVVYSKQTSASSLY